MHEKRAVIEPGRTKPEDGLQPGEKRSAADLGCDVVSRLMDDTRDRLNARPKPTPRASDKD